MSRTIPVAVQAHLDTSTRTMADCLVVTQQVPGSSTVLRVTTLNAALVVAGDTYAALGYTRTDMSAEADMGVGSEEVDGILDSPYLTEDDVRAGRWDGASWRKFRVNYLSPASGVIELGSGTLGTVSHGRIRFKAELLGLMQRVQNSIGNLNSALCIHNLGDNNVGPGRGNGCTVNLVPFTLTGTVATMDSDFYGVHDPARVEADAYFSNGIFRVTSGVMTGMEFEIRAYIVGFWILFTALPYDVTGATYEIVRGCDKSKTACHVFGKVTTDRLASDYTQGNDAAVQVARHNG